MRVLVCVCVCLCMLACMHALAHLHEGVCIMHVYIYAC
jgi:hypothetical protein